VNPESIRQIDRLDVIEPGYSLQYSTERMWIVAPGGMPIGVASFPKVGPFPQRVTERAITLLRAHIEWRSRT
jgi:hypothetical protein